MRTKFILLVLLGTQVSCGGVDAGGLEAETMPPDFLSTPSWPDSPDLGVVVSSGIVPSDTPPPPEFTR